MPDGKGDARSLPTFTEDLCDGFGAQLYPGSIATDRTSQSWSGPPDAHGIEAAGEERPSDRALSSTAKRPIHQVRQAADDSRDVNHWFSFLAPIPSSLAGTNRLVVSVRPYVVEAASGLTPNPGFSLPPASTGPCEDRRRAFHPARSISASWRTADLVDHDQRVTAEPDEFVLEPSGLVGGSEPV
ncbi:hypothetical protein ACWEQL_42175, partial [Kitasatospora sp. NPDC004240]